MKVAYAIHMPQADRFYNAGASQSDPRQDHPHCYDSKREAESICEELYNEEKELYETRCIEEITVYKVVGIMYSIQEIPND